MKRWFMTLVLLLAGIIPQGCVVYAVDEPMVYAPSLSRPLVDCLYDPAYAEYYWYLEVQASDPDNDVVAVGMDLYDAYSGAYLETQNLYYVGGSTWNVQVYETYSRYLDCPYAGAFDYVYWAQDSYGNYVEISTPGPGNTTPTYTGPVLSAPYVECGYDATYADYYWYAEVFIDDAQGPGDLTGANLMIYLAGGAQPVEQWPLYYDAASGVWWREFMQGQSYYLDCRYPQNFGFQFTATDRAGQLGYVNAASVVVY